MRKKILVLAMCAALTLLLAGCGNSAGNAVSNAASKAGEAVSKAGEGIDNAMSRAESALDGDSSRESSGMLDADSTVDSGNDGFIGDESGVSSLFGDSASDLEGSGVSGSSANP